MQEIRNYQINWSTKLHVEEPDEDGEVEDMDYLAAYRFRNVISEMSVTEVLKLMKLSRVDNK